MKFVLAALLVLVPVYAIADQRPYSMFRKPCGEVITKAANHGGYTGYAYQDANQEALLKLYERCLKLGPDAVGGIEGIIKYLTRSVRNARVDEMRGTQRLTVGSDLVVKQLERDNWSLAAQSGQPVAIQLELDDVLEAKGIAYSHLDEFRAELTDADIAVLLGYVVGYEVKEIATIIKTSPDNVYKIKKGAEKKVRKILSGGSLEGSSGSSSGVSDFIGVGFFTLFLVYLAYVGFRGAYDAIFNPTESRRTTQHAQRHQPNMSVRENVNVNVNTRNH